MWLGIKNSLVAVDSSKSLESYFFILFCQLDSSKKISSLMSIDELSKSVNSYEPSKVYLTIRPLRDSL